MLATGYDQIQPKYILGSDHLAGAAAEHMVGAEIDRPNQLRDHLPFYPFARGRTLVVPRVETLATASFLGSSTDETDASTSALASPPEELEVTSIVGDVAISDYPVDVQSYSIDQLDLQMEFKKIAIRLAFWSRVFRAGPAGGMRGLPDLVHSSQVLGAGGPLTLDALDDLVALVSEANAEMDRKVLLMNGETFKWFVRAVRGADTTLQYATRGGRRYAVHNGVTVLVCDWIPGDEVAGDCKNTTSVYCCTLGVEDKGVFGVYPPDLGTNGLVVEKLQGLERKAGVAYRLRWYTMLALGHVRGLARLSGIVHPST